LAFILNILVTRSRFFLVQVVDRGTRLDRSRVDAHVAETPRLAVVLDLEYQAERIAGRIAGHADRRFLFLVVADGGPDLVRGRQVVDHGVD
jgi:hypothetical protein